MIRIQGLPATGCNVFNGSYVDNYYSNIRTRYYIYGGNAIQSSSSTYSSIPSGAYCLRPEELPLYDPLFQTSIIIEVVIGVIAVMALAYHVVIRPFIKMKKGD